MAGLYSQQQNNLRTFSILFFIHTNFLKLEQKTLIKYLSISTASAMHRSKVTPLCLFCNSFLYIQGSYQPCYPQDCSVSSCWVGYDFLTHCLPRQNILCSRCNLYSLFPSPNLVRLDCIKRYFFSYFYFWHVWS